MRKSGILIVLLLCANAFAQETAEQHYKAGVQAGQDAQKASIFSKPGLAIKAREEFERALQIDPNYMPARFGLIEFYLEAPSIVGGGEDKAFAQANEIKKRDAIDGHRAFATIYYRQKKPDLAKKEYADAVKEQPNSPKAHYWLGVSYIGDKNYAQATNEFETSVKLDPGYMPGWFQIGHMAALAGTSFDRGEESLRKYLAYTPNWDEPALYRAQYWLGMIFEKQGKKADAKASYAKSLSANPNQKDVQEALKRVS